MGTLHSDRIHLRPIVKDDLPMLNEWKNNEDVYKFLGGVFPCLNRYPGKMARFPD